jgi:ribosomal protein S18 acetylase RimI-like enzyme
MASENGEKRKPEVEIREMGIDDIPVVYHLGEDLFTSQEYPILYRTWDPYEVTDYFTSYPEYCLVAETEGKIVGFILADIIEKEGTAWKKYGYVSWIGVAEAYQRTNLGHRLYNKLEDILQEEGVRMVIADTDADNKGAIDFFDAMGFSKAAEHVWLVKTFPTTKQKEDALKKKRSTRLKRSKRLAPKE